MPRYPGAVWRDVGAPGNFSNGTMHDHLGVVLHVNDAQSDDLYGWITGDNGMSCHFQVNKAGKVYQYIDTAYSSWCQKDGNNTYLSIESQGLASEPATRQQIEAIGKILAWVHKTHDVPLQLAEVPGQRGFGWHGMGAAHGADWGHPNCPGVRRDQRDEMLLVARGNQLPTEEDITMDAITKKYLDAQFNDIDSKFKAVDAHIKQYVPRAVLMVLTGQGNALYTADNMDGKGPEKGTLSDFSGFKNNPIGKVLAAQAAAIKALADKSGLTADQIEAVITDAMKQVVTVDVNVQGQEPPK